MADKKFPLSVVIKGVDRVGPVLAAVQGKLRKFGAVASGINSSIRSFGARSGLPVLGAALGRVGGSLTDLGRRVAVVGGLLGTLAATGVLAGIEIVKSFADAASAINDASISLGVDAEQLQKWQFAARQNGVANEDLTKSLAKLQNNLGKASMGGPMLKMLHAMKIKLKDAHGHLRKTEELLPEIADGIAKIKSPIMRTTVAMAFMGKTGGKLIPMLLGGSKGLKDYGDEATRVGLILSDKSVSAADDFGDAWDKMTDAIKGAKNTIGAQLMPVISKLITDLTEFVVKNRPVIQAFFANFAKELPGNIRKTVKVLGDMRDKMQPVINVVAALVDKFGGANVILAAFAAAVTAFLVPAIYSCVTALYAMSAALLGTPVGWIIIGIVAIVAGMKYLYDRFELARTVIDAVSDSAIWFFKNFTPLGILINRFEEFASGIHKLHVIFSDLWLMISNGFKIATQACADFAAKIAKAVPDWVKNLFSAGIKTISIVGGAPIQAGMALGAAVVGRGQAAQKQEVAVKVAFDNLPAGASVKSSTKGKPNFELNQGYANGMRNH